MELRPVHQRLLRDNGLEESRKPPEPVERGKEREGRPEGEADSELAAESPEHEPDAPTGPAVGRWVGVPRARGARRRVREGGRPSSYPTTSTEGGPRAGADQTPRVDCRRAEGRRPAAGVQGRVRGAPSPPVPAPPCRAVPLLPRDRRGDPRVARRSVGLEEEESVQQGVSPVVRPVEREPLESGEEDVDGGKEEALLLVPAVPGEPEEPRRDRSTSPSPRHPRRSLGSERVGADAPAWETGGTGEGPDRRTSAPTTGRRTTTSRRREGGSGRRRGGVRPRPVLSPRAPTYGPWV